MTASSHLAINLSSWVLLLPNSILIYRPWQRRCHPSSPCRVGVMTRLLPVGLGRALPGLFFLVKSHQRAEGRPENAILDCDEKTISLRYLIYVKHRVGIPWYAQVTSLLDLSPIRLWSGFLFYRDEKVCLRSVPQIGNQTGRKPHQRYPFPRSRPCV